jgi:hypothetical protein
MDYAEVFRRLSYETAVVTFLKKDGTVRIMLGTRNLNTVSLVYGFQGPVLGGHDKRCNINNGNVAIFDLAIGDARTFSISRVLDIQWAGMVDTKEKYDEVFQNYLRYKEEYEKNKPTTVDFDSINTGTDNGGKSND